MSPKKKNKFKLIPFTAGKLPSVSKSMPPATSAIPSVSKEIPSVSKPIPLVSAIPNVTIPRHWGIMPSRKWEVSKIPATRRREPMRREMNEISEEDYKIEETKLKRRIKDLEEKEEVKAKAKEIKEKPKKKEKKGRKNKWR